MPRPAPPVLAALAAAALALAACRGGAASPSAAGPVAADSGLVAHTQAELLIPDGQLEWGTLTVLVNGYPVAERRGRPVYFGGTWMVGLGGAFVGAGNVVRVEARPVVTVGLGGVHVAELSGTAYVTNNHRIVEDGGGHERRVPVAGEVVARADLGAAWARWRAGLEAHLDSLGAAGALPSGTQAEAGSAGMAAVADSAAAYVEARPLIVEMTFDSDPQSGVAEVLGGRRIVDRDSVAAFALAVRDAYRDRNAAWLAEHYWPVADRTRTLAGQIADAGGAEAASAVLTSFFEGDAADPWDLAFGADDLVVRPWAGRRVWSVAVTDAREPRPFLSPPPPRIGGFQDLYVAAPAGELRFFFGL